MRPSTSDPIGRDGRPSYSPVTLRPGLVALDWLTVNMDAPPAPSRGHPWEQVEPVYWDSEHAPTSDEWRRYIVVPTAIRTAQFSRVSYLVTMDGEKAATIWSTPHNTALYRASWVQVQFANWTLYTGEWVNLFRMFRAYGLDYTGIARVDICADGLEGAGGDFQDVVRRALFGGDFSYYGKGKWMPDIFRRNVNGFVFGTRGSNKFVRCYRKKREMKAQGIKQHIVDAWLVAFGLDAMADPREVNRFEVSLRGKEVRRYFADERSADWLEGLDKCHQRVDVFASVVPSFFDFRTPAKYVRDTKPAALWDWSALLHEPTRVERKERTIALTDHTIKTYLRAMYMVATVTNDAAGYRACEMLARSCGDAWVEWYNRAKYKWAKDHVRMERAKDPRTLRILEAMRTDEAERAKDAERAAILRRLSE